MDRLLHHCHIIVMEGHSYRNPPPRPRGGEATDERKRAAAS